MITEYEFMDYINQTGITYREKGDELLFQYCPYCESQQKHAPYDHFAFHRKKMVFNCVKCGEKGNLYKFKLDRGDIKPVTKAKPIIYKRPVLDDSITENKDDAYEWYQKTRGISVEVLKKYQVGFMRRDNVPIITYQYFSRENELINRKYRSADKKKVWTDKDAEKIYYGLQFVDFSRDTLHVCEGEDDCHALVQMGLENVVSVPFGAGTYTPAMDQINKQFKVIVMIFDNDDRGQHGAHNFSEKAGPLKCRNVILPFKDARDCLLNGLDIFDIQKEINKAQIFKHQNILKAGDIRAEFEKTLFDTRRLLGYMTPIPEFNRLLGGIRMGELSVVIGHTGVGKSTFAYNVAAWMEGAGVPVMVFPFENRIESVIRKFIEIYSCDSVYGYDYVTQQYVLAKNKHWIEEQINAIDEKHLYFLNKKHRSKNGYFDVNLIGKIIEYAVKFYNVKFIVMDHLHYFLKLSGAKSPHLVIEETMRMIKQWTDDYGIHIMLNVHPHMTDDSRTGKAVKLGINSSKGSSGIQQECDNFMVIEKPDPKKGERKMMASCLRIEKNREMGKTGMVMFKVLENRNTYVEYSESKDESESYDGKGAACKESEW